MHLTIEMLTMKKKRKSKNDTAFMATLLFTVHPLHTEVVSGLVGRADLLCSILMIISLLFYKRLIKNNSVILFIIIYFTIAIAVLCKETAITALVSRRYHFFIYTFHIHVIFLGIMQCIRYILYKIIKK